MARRSAGDSAMGDGCLLRASGAVSWHYHAADGNFTGRQAEQKKSAVQAWKSMGILMRGYVRPLKSGQGVIPCVDCMKYSTGISEM